MRYRQGSCTVSARRLLGTRSSYVVAQSFEPMTPPNVTAAPDSSTVLRLQRVAPTGAAAVRSSAPLRAQPGARVEPRPRTGPDARAELNPISERHAHVEPALLPQHGSREPLYFSAGGHQLFAWLHSPAAGVRVADVGMVICKPFGYESICANRSMREFADAAAALGLPSLRLDYAGTGDAEDLPPGSDELATWTQDILAAVQELQRRTGVTRICLLGIRLGALLASLAAARSRAVSALVLIAPVIDGRRYLRELRRVQLAAADMAVVVPCEGAAERTGALGTAEHGQFQVSGFSLAAATITAIQGVDLSASKLAPARQILLIDRDDLPGAREWAQILVRLGAVVDYQVLSGVVAMVWTAPHFSAVPRGMISATARWLERLVEAPHSQHSPREHSSGKHSQPAHSSARLTPAAARGLQRASNTSARMLQLSDASRPARIVTERPLFFAAGPMRFGIVTEPPPGEAGHHGVIFVNDGATYHVGANRLNVALARRWAREGYTVLRMDIAGLGESDTRPGQRFDEAFPVGAIEDIAAAVRYLRSSCGSTEVTLAGLCSGAYHCLRAAVSGLPINRILLVNPQNYFWKRGMKVEDLQLVEIVRAASTYRRRVLSVRNWGKLLRGEADVRRIAWVQLCHAWLRLQAPLRNAARCLHIRLPRDLGRELEQLVGRGVQVVFVFARDEAGLELLKMQAGSSLQRLGTGCRLHIIDGADHIFSQSGPRRALEDVLSRELLVSHHESDAGLTTVAVAAR